MKISDIQRNALKLSEKHGWCKSEPKERFIRLIGEMGELADEVIQYKADSNNKTETDRSIAFEMYDVVWNVCDLANKLGIDLEPYFEEKSSANKLRNWKR